MKSTFKFILIILLFFSSQIDNSQNQVSDAINIFMLDKFNAHQEQNTSLQKTKINALEYQLELQKKEQQKTLLYLITIFAVLIFIGIMLYLLWKKEKENSTLNTKDLRIKK